MTPIGHCASGMAAGGILSPFLNRICRIPYRALTIIFIITSLLPDIDGLSLLFDHRIYMGKMWYSHHMAGHSLIGAALFSLIISSVYIVSAITTRGIVNFFREDRMPLEYRARRWAGALIAAFTGCIVHLLGDMPTPPGPWGGISLLWPAKKMSGGWGNIYWHNYYLIYISIFFMMIFLVHQFAAGILSSFRYRPVNIAAGLVRLSSMIISAVFIFKMGFFIYSGNYRDMGRAKWLQYNRTMVPEKYMKNSGKYHAMFSVFWRKTVFKKEDLIEKGGSILNFFEGVRKLMAPGIEGVMYRIQPDDEEMKTFRALQAHPPGTGDCRNCDFRVAKRAGLR